jgi:hypothetical protein
MEITERAILRVSKIESHSRSGVRIVGYWLQFVRELGPASVESAGGYSSRSATCVMGAGSHTSIVHFFLSSSNLRQTLIILSGNTSPQGTRMLSSIQFVVAEFPVGV